MRDVLDFLVMGVGALVVLTIGIVLGTFAMGFALGLTLQ
jgi:hypothetical protein